MNNKKTALILFMAVIFGIFGSSCSTQTDTAHSEDIPDRNDSTGITPVLNIQAELIDEFFNGSGSQNLVVSPDCHRAAYSTSINSTYYFCIDGETSKPYEYAGEIVFSANSKNVACAACTGDTWVVLLNGKEIAEYPGFVEDLTFSPDGKKLAYRIFSDNQWTLVIEGRQYSGFDAVKIVGFSPDSRRFAYMASTGDKRFAVIDGKKENEYDMVQANIAYKIGGFSPDSKHFAYLASINGKMVVVENGIEGPPYNEIPFLQYSPDSTKLAAIAAEDDDYLMIINGTECSRFDYISSLDLTWIADSDRIAYIAQEAGKTFVQYDTVSCQSYSNWISELVFSPDGNRYGYSVWTNSRDQFIVLDGEKQETYNRAGGLVFSPNGQRYAYEIATQDYSYRYIVDGEELPLYDTGVRDFTFSPDSKRTAYVGVNNGQKMVVDGIENRKFYTVSEPIFTRDSNNVVYIAREGSIRIVVVDGEIIRNDNGEKYSIRSEIILESSNSFSFIGEIDRKLYHVHVEIEEPKEYNVEGR